MCDAGPDGTINTCTVGEVCGECRCQPAAVCGNGVIEAYDNETCDDGNTTAGDGCDSSCEIEAPLFIPPTFVDSLSGSCIDSRLPTINSDEYLPTRWQLEANTAVDTTATNCTEVIGNNGGTGR